MSNYIDTRDLQDRIEELESQIDDINAEIESYLEDLEDDSCDEDDIDEIKSNIEDAEELKEELTEELNELIELKGEIPEWFEGNTLIPEEYWVEYVQQLLEDCGDIPRDLPWYIVVDWEATADNIAVDYSTCEYQGNTYYYRNC